MLPYSKNAMSRMSTKLAAAHSAANAAAGSSTTSMVNRTLNVSSSFHRIITMNHPHRRGLMTLVPTTRLVHSRLPSMRAPRYASLVTECDAKEEPQEQQAQPHELEVCGINDDDDATHQQKEGDGPTCQDLDRRSLSPFDLLKEKNINEAILALGKADKWKEILCLYHENEEDFTALNYETVMSQLGRIRSVHHQRDDPRVQEYAKTSATAATATSIRRTLPGAAFVNERDAEAFMSQVTYNQQVSDEEREFDEDLMNGPLFEVFYTDLSSKLALHRTPWMGARAVASILHDIAKLDLVDNQSTETIFSLFEDDKTAALLFENNDPQDIVNCAWACASLEIESPNLFRLLDQNAEWLLENGNQQQLSNCAWACGVLGVQAPNLSRLLLLNQGYVPR